MNTKAIAGRSALLLALLAAPALALQEPALDSRRAAILDTAERFATVRWRAEERHAFHGDDPSGIRVDTPDVSIDPGGWKPGEENVGMPYAWGGFTSLDGLEGELALPRYAGHVPLQGNAHSSDKTVGVDCSGFVSRCWDLPLKQSTRSLGALCYELDDYWELQPGDILNRFDSHVALFVGWADEARETAEVIEAARLRVEHATYPLETLVERNFRPMRYKLLDERWQPMPTPDPERDTIVAAEAPRRFEQDRGADAPPPTPVFPALLAGEVLPGSWARYDAEETRLAGAATSTWMAVKGAPDTLELQRLLALGDDSVATGSTIPRESSWAEVLTAFAAFSNPLQDLRVTESSIVPGTYLLGVQELPARRLTAQIEGNMLARSTLYPCKLELECVLSDEVPLLGICEGQFALEIEYGMRGEDRVIGLEERRFTLTAFGL